MKGLESRMATGVALRARHAEFVNQLAARVAHRHAERHSETLRVKALLQQTKRRI